MHNGSTGLAIPASTRFWRWVLLVGLVLALAVQLYPNLGAYFIADDFGWLRFARDQTNLADAALKPSLGDWTTPVSNAIFWTLFQGFEYAPAGYYLAVAGLHLVNALLVYVLVRNLARRDDVAVVAALIFAFHFVHWSDWGPLVWISAFVQLVVAVFYLAALVLIVRALQTGGRGAYLGSVICFGLALFAKETALTLPAVLVAWYLLGIFPPELRWRRGLALLAPFVLVLGGYLAFKLLVQQTSDRYFEAGLYGIGPHLLTNWKYFSNLIMPNPESAPVRSFLQRTFPAWAYTGLLWTLLVVRLGLLASVVLIWWRGTRLARGWIALSLIVFLPFAGFAGGLAGATRYFYLPAVGFSALAARGVLWLWDQFGQRIRQKAWAPALTALLVVGIWAVNLAPIRAWQRQMLDSTGIKVELQQVLEHQIATEQAPADAVYLRGFPADSEQDLKRIVQLFYRVDPITLARDEIYPVSPSADVLRLEYRQGHVVVAGP